MVTETFAFDAAEMLDSSEAQAAYLSEIMGGGDAAAVAQALGTIARARGMTAVARDAGMSRESLYRALSGNGKPEFATIMRVMQALGLNMAVRANDNTGGDADEKPASA
jgi:probable addiction module antidote protein